MKILFYFNHDDEAYHFESLIDYLYQHASSDIYFYSNSRLRFNSHKGIWLKQLNEVIADIVIFNDAPSEDLSNHGFLLNVSLQLISKGKYYVSNSKVYKGHMAHVQCVPGPWHQKALEGLIGADICVTGSLQMDELQKPIDKNYFCQKHSVNPDKPIILWKPTHEMELSSISVLWSRIQVLTPQYQVVIFMSYEVEEFFKSHFLHLSQLNPDILVVDEDILSWMKVSSLMISDFTQAMFEYLILDRPVVVVECPLQVDDPNYHPESFEYKHRDIGPRISSARDLLAAVSSQLENPNSYQEARLHVLGKLTQHSSKSTCENILEIIQHSPHDDSKEQSVMAVVIAPNDKATLEKHLSNPLISKVFAYQPQVQILPHSGVEVIANAQALLTIAQQLNTQLFFLEFGPGSIVGNDMTSLISVLQYDSSIDMVGPLTIKDSQLAKVQNHMKMHLYQLEQQVSPESLADFILATNQSEKLLVPQLDTSCLMVRADVLRTLAQEGLEATLSSSNHLKCIVKDRILV